MPSIHPSGDDFSDNCPSLHFDLIPLCALIPQVYDLSVDISSEIPTFSSPQNLNDRSIVDRPRPAITDHFIMSDLFGDTDDTSDSLFAPGGGQPSRPSISEPDSGLPQLPISKPSPPPPPSLPSPSPAQPPSEAPPPLPPAAAAEPKPEAPRAPRRVQVVKTKDLVKRSLNHLQRDVTRRFDEVTEIIESLKSSDPPRGAVLSNDRIMRDIQSAVAAADDKDRMLRQKQLVIESMSSSLTEREERANLRKQLAITMEDIAAEIARFADADQEFEFKSKEVDRLKLELAQSATRAESGEARLRGQIEREMARLKRDFEEEEKASDLRVQQLKEELKILSEQLKQFTTENQKLALRVPKATQADLERTKAAIQGKLKVLVQQMTVGVNQMITESLDLAKSYGGKVVQSAMKNALQTQALAILNPSDDED
jgi:hypothetical protein